MSMEIKLKDYFKANGIQKKWFAEKLGMPPQQFSQVINGYVRLPRKYWKQVIEMTGGKITLADILADKLSDVESIEIKNGKSCEKCEVSLKDFNADT